MPHTGIRKQAMNHSMTNPLLATQLLIKPWRILLVLVCSMASTHAALPDHPRLLFPESAEAPLQQRIQTDPLAGKLYLGLLRQADHAISLPVCRYDIPDGKRLLAQSRYALSNILHCSMAWRLSGKTKYYDRAILEMDAACGLKDWNPSHFLDTAEMSTAVAIGYDWLYQKLTPAQRQSYAKALREKGLEPARKGFTGKLSWWANPRNNWGQVCATGLLLAERALENEGDPIHAGRIEASKSLDQCKKFYQPGGAYPKALATGIMDLSIMCLDSPHYKPITHHYVSRPLLNSKHPLFSPNTLPALQVLYLTLPILGDRPVKSAQPNHGWQVPSKIPAPVHGYEVDSRRTSKRTVKIPPQDMIVFSHCTFSGYPTSPKKRLIPSPQIPNGRGHNPSPHFAVLGTTPMLFLSP